MMYRPFVVSSKSSSCTIARPSLNNHRSIIITLALWSSYPIAYIPTLNKYGTRRVCFTSKTLNILHHNNITSVAEYYNIILLYTLDRRTRIYIIFFQTTKSVFNAVDDLLITTVFYNIVSRKRHRFDPPVGGFQFYYFHFSTTGCALTIILGIYSHRVRVQQLNFNYLPIRGRGIIIINVRIVMLDNVYYYSTAASDCVGITVLH